MSDNDLLPEVALQRIDTLVAAIDRAEAAGIECSDSIRIHFLKNFTIEPIEPYLKFHLLREAIEPKISHGGYDSIIQEALDPGSELRVDSPEMVVLALELTLLDPDYGSYRWTANRAIERLLEMYDALRQNTSSLIVVNTMMSPFLSLEGVAATKRRAVREVARVNDWIWEYANSHMGRFVVADWERLLRLTGKDNAIDQRFWRTSLAPFKAAFLDLLAREVAKIGRALKGKAKKCLILDCDDTLWGGVIGEDGIENVKLVPVEWPERAFFEFQRNILALHERGVLVCICSKNNAEEVWEVMQNQPYCLLQQSHLSAWRINWDDKAANIVALSAELNLPLDSFVFVDDSPRECQRVREALPQVTVLQVPDPLYEYPSLLLQDGLFDTLNVSDEDRNRAALYREQAARARDRSIHVDLDGYLASLDQTMSFWEAGEKDRPRIAQLTQKTNQFNLTTRRYSEGQIEALMQDDNAAVLAMSVCDRYGEMGTTGVLIARRSDEDAHIDSLLLSCRILGRKLEIAFVDQCLLYLETRWGISTWHAEYFPSKKNAQVADFWEQVGFSLHEETDRMKSYGMAAGQRCSGYSHAVSIVEAKTDAGSN